jgi:NHLM bacteriocin system ABC transporter ATP-binding protein
MDGSSLQPGASLGTIVLQPGQVLPLDASPRAMQIVQGRLEVYAISGGLRCFLGELHGSDWLFAGDREPGRLIAMSPEGARLDPIMLTQMPNETDLAGAEAWAALDRWLQVMSEGLARHAPVRPVVVPVMPGQTEIAEPSIVTSVKDVTWVAASTASRFMGAGALPPLTPLPLTPSTWLCVEPPSTLVAVDTRGALRRHRHADLLAAFHDRIALCLAEWQREAAAARSHRLADLVSRTERRMAAARARFTAVLHPSAVPPPREPDDAEFVLDRVAGPAAAPPPKDAPVLEVREAAERRGLLVREVTLAGGWWRRDMGKLVAFRRDDGRPVALLPDLLGRYRAYLREAPSQRVNATVASDLAATALIVTTPLPNRAMLARELMGICFLVARLDFTTLALATLASSLLGLAMPLATQQVVDVFIPDRLLGPLLGFGVALTVLTLCSTLLRVATDMARARLDSRISAAIQTGVMDRMLRMPAALLRSTNSVDLARQVLSVDQVRRTLLSTALGSGLSGVFGLSGFAVLLGYSPLAGALAFGLFGLLIALSVITGIQQHRGLVHGEAMETDNSAFTLQVIQNVSTLRCFGAERRAWTVWADDAARTRTRALASRGAYLVFDACVTGYDLFALALIFLVLGKAGGSALSTGAYLAFVVTYQGFLGASEGLSRAVVQTAAQIPTIQRARRVLATAPENPPMLKDPGTISGALAVSNIGFSYQSGQRVLNGVSLRIEAGQSVAFVGPSGCGKSTLLSIILGLDNPHGGMVMYDGQDLATLDRRRLRRQIGVVRQSGRLLAGSIYENIVGLHRGTLDDAWAAAEKAAVAGEIRSLPMGMHTVVNEGTSTFSGGQVQRLLIARALAGKPRLMVLDEATSALDNLTQAEVTRNLDRLGITRIIVAHRLSTLMHADMIHFLDRGRIVESGSASQLIAADGRFAEFIRRQAL